MKPKTTAEVEMIKERQRKMKEQKSIERSRDREREKVQKEKKCPPPNEIPCSTVKCSDKFTQIKP